MMDDHNVITSKFSMLEDNEVYVELEKFVYYLSHKNHDDNNVMMEFDEIVGELMLELAKGLKRYGDLSKGKLKAVIRKMMDNRISELRYKFYVTSRKMANVSISIDVEANAGKLPGNNADPSRLVASAERVAETRSALSDVARSVFDAIIYGHDQLSILIWLSAIRAGNVYKNSKVKVRPWQIADALIVDVGEVKDSLLEIKSVYAEVCGL